MNANSSLGEVLPNCEAMAIGVLAGKHINATRVALCAIGLHHRKIIILSLANSRTVLNSRGWGNGPKAKAILI
jgi:hypothetical protein